MLIVFQPDDSILFYKVPEVILAMALSALAAISLLRPDPLRLGQLVNWFRDRPADDDDRDVPVSATGR
ncbi:hypothetical protein [Gordonia insulae]